MSKPKWHARAIATMIVLVSGSCAGHSQDREVTTAALPVSSHSADNSPATIGEGRSLFNQTCAHCHGPDAMTGLPERNLRHLRARYGAEMHSMFLTTVTNGRPDKGMPVWGEVLDQKTIDQIYSYLETVQDRAD